MALERFKFISKIFYKLFVCTQGVNMVPDVSPHLTASKPALNHYSSIIFLLSVFISLPKRNRQNSHVSTIYTANFIFNQLDTILLNSYVYN